MSDRVRTFIALPVSAVPITALASAQNSMKRLAEKAGVEARWSKPEQLHLTVKFLGEIESHELGAIAEVVKWHATKTLPLATRWSGVIAMGGPRRAGAVVAAVADDDGAVASLAAEIEEDLLPLGIEREKRAFRPHVTLARLKTKANVAALLEAGQLQPAEVTFDEIRLYESRLTPEGGVYSVLARAAFGVNR